MDSSAVVRFRRGSDHTLLAGCAGGIVGGAAPSSRPTQGLAFWCNKGTGLHTLTVDCESWL